MTLTRDQQRANHAYSRVAAVVDNKELKKYKILVNSLGPSIVRSGLAAAIAFLQRSKDSSVCQQFVADFASGLPAEFKAPCSLAEFASYVRQLDSDDYMLLTRESLKQALWFKRAVQAYSNDDGGA